MLLGVRGAKRIDVFGVMECYVAYNEVRWQQQIESFPVCTLADFHLRRVVSNVSRANLQSSSCAKIS